MPLSIFHILLVWVVLWSQHIGVSHLLDMDATLIFSISTAKAQHLTCKIS